MRNRFNDNVPTRKPRTQIGRVLTELASEVEETNEKELEEAVVAEAGVAREALSGTEVADQATSPAEVPPLGAPRERMAPDSSRLADGRERIAQLRERLAMATQPTPAVVEPRRTAAAVREVVEELRARLETTIRERTELTAALQAARADLARAGTELEQERKARLAAEARAEERAAIADDAVAEVEALAAERDQVLAELGEQRRLDEEQAAVLMEAEAALALRESERASDAGKLEELRDLLDARAVEVADLESRLEAEAADRARIQERCLELEAEVTRLGDAREALEAIEATLGRRP